MKKLFKNSFFFLVSTPFLLLLATYIAPHVSPERSEALALLAYGYPYIILLCLVSFVITVFSRQWKIVLIYVLVFLIGWNLHLSYFAMGSEKTVEQTDLKIMTYNVRNFDLYEQLNFPKEQARDRIFEFLAQEQADILCFQEFFHEERPRKFVTYQKIAELTGLPYHAQSMTADNKKTVFFGCVIFSRFPIVNSGKLDIESKASNHCVFADVVKDNDTIRFYNFHIGSISFQADEYALFEDLEMNLSESDQQKGKRLIKRFLEASIVRAIQLERILTHAKESPYPTILCGDLNDTPSSYAYRQLQSQYFDAFRETGRGLGKTYRGKMPANRIDYIFYDKHFEARRTAVQKDLLSDHLALIGEIRSLP